MAEITIKGRWQLLDGDRQSHLERARRCAELTIPSLLPPVGTDSNTALPTPWQGLGARGVNNLASKLLLSLLPPNTPFFRLMISQKALNDLMMLNLNLDLSDIEAKLAEWERIIMHELEAQAVRVPAFEAFKLLITTGNALIYMPDKGGMKVYRLDQYVTKRDPMGNLIELIIRERIHKEALPKDIQEAIEREQTIPSEIPSAQVVNLFTRVVRVDNKWEVSQAAENIEIPSSRGSFALDALPWIPLRWTAPANEDYGRGLVEEYLGDLHTLEALSKALTEGAMAAAFVIFLVNPNSTTRPEKLQKARNTSFVEGVRDDVAALQLEKYADFAFVQERIAEIERRLEQAFLLIQSVQRDAERVTASEIMALVKELEDSLGGVYSVLSQEFQLPIIRRLMVQLNKRKVLPSFPKDSIQPVIVTGVEALGRIADLQNLRTFVEALAPLGPEALATWVKIDEYVRRAATATNLDPDGLVRTEEEVAAMQQQQQMAQLAAQIAPGAAQELVKGAVANTQQQQAQ